MQLDSGQFLLLLFLTWMLWRLLPKSAASAVLLIASILFYASSSLAHLGLMLVVATINFAAIKALSAWEDSPRRHVAFYLAVGFDTLVLVFYKWAALFLHLPAAPDFFKTLFPLTHASTLSFPLGLSFFTFQVISCVTDVYRRSYQWTAGTGTFYLYAFFFPQISAGPIPRAESLVPQLDGPRRLGPGNLEAGIVLFAYGLFKKLVVANRLLPYVDNVFAPDAHVSTVPIALAFVFNALYLYADFSGYTDMARGTARIFGIDLLENFNQPFVAETVTDFWRRWHMTLSSWLKDYLYMPLVIRLRNFGKYAVVFSFMLTFLLCGLWHRLDWPFAVFGLLHGSALSIEFLTRQSRQGLIKALPFLESPWIGRSYVFIFFALTNVMFRVTDLPQALPLYAQLVILRRPAGLAEICAYTGPLLFILNFIALGLWYIVAAFRPKSIERDGPRFVLLCAVIILVFGKLQEGGFVYVTF